MSYARIGRQTYKVQQLPEVEPYMSVIQKVESFLFRLTPCFVGADNGFGISQLLSHVKSPNRGAIPLSHVYPANTIFTKQNPYFFLTILIILYIIASSQLWLTIKQNLVFYADDFTRKESICENMLFRHYSSTLAEIRMVNFFSVTVFAVKIISPEQEICCY